MEKNKSNQKKEKNTADLAWEMFESTGNYSYYLFYHDLLEEENTQG